MKNSRDLLSFVVLIIIFLNYEQSWEITFSWLVLYYRACTPEDYIVNAETYWLYCDN
jgi:hypothetical protein